jgi:hypothetical protein
MEQKDAWEYVTFDEASDVPIAYSQAASAA